MAAMTAEQLNNVLPDTTEFTLCYLSFCGKRKNDKYNPFTQYNGKALPRACVKILSLIDTETRAFGKDTKITKMHFAKKLGLSRQTVSDSLKRLTTDNLIEETEKDVYKIIPRVNRERYVVLDNYLHTTKFNIQGKLKKLLQTAVIVLSDIKSFYLMTDENGAYINYDFASRKPINYFCASEKSFETRLNLPPSTVGYAILELLRAGLLFRNKRLRYKDDKDKVKYKIVDLKDVPGNTTSIFTIPYEVLAVKQGAAQNITEIEFNANLEEREISETEIEATYAELREQAQEKFNNVKAILNSDEEFKAARNELNAAIVQHVTAPNNDSTDNLAAAQRRYFSRLATLGISEDEFEPQYNCKKCNDTGKNLDTGQRCTCRSIIKQMIINRVFKA